MGTASEIRFGSPACVVRFPLFLNGGRTSHVLLIFRYYAEHIRFVDHTAHCQPVNFAQREVETPRVIRVDSRVRGSGQVCCFLRLPVRARVSEERPNLELNIFVANG